MAAASVKAASVSAASVMSLNAKYGVIQLRQLYRDALDIRPDWKQLEDEYVLVFPADKDVRQAVKDYGKDPNVVSASPNYRVFAFDTTPNDTYFLSGDQWGLTKIKAPQGWDRTTGTPDAVIAVLDSGINYNHEDFALKVDLTHAKNYIPVPPTSDPLDDYGHGTAVSGVIGAATNNSKGVAGMDWNAKILPIKVLNSAGGGDMSDTCAALAYLTALRSSWEATGGTSGVNVVVVNMSLGQYNDGVKFLHDGVMEYVEENPNGIKERCLEAYNQGIILVAAAGNGDVDWNTYPAYYPTVIAVAATDSSDIRSRWSNTDPITGRTQASNYASWVDVSAPGTEIMTVDRGGSYSRWSGTSLSCPFVAGLMALMKAANPALSNTQVMSQVGSAADNIDALQELLYRGKLGSGRINVYRALAGYLIEITSPASGDYIKGTKEVRGTASGWNFLRYQLDALRNGSVEVNIVSTTESVESGILANWDTAGLNGEYALRLRVVLQDLSSTDATVAIFIDNTSPEVAINSPTDGSTVEGRINIVGQAKDQHLDRYVLEYGAGTTPSSYQAIGTFYSSVESGVLGTWETTGLSGYYRLRLTAYDRAGTSSAVSALLNLMGEPPTKEVNPQTGLPLTFGLPNPFDRTVTSETSFVYSLSGNFNVTIYLFDLNGNLIWRKSYLAGENGGKAGPNNPSWNGQSLYGERAVNGLYFYQVTADQKVLARGRLIVLN
jgi:thermitase